jgi:hypothetical protein
MREEERHKEAAKSSPDATVESVLMALDHRASRTVSDFETPQALLRALQSSAETGSRCSPVELGCAWVSSGGVTNLEKELQGLLVENAAQTEMCNLDVAMDWVLENYDAATTHRQTMENELRRLLVLKSFLALDIERHEAFERITALAQEHFHCPINLIGLMDLGRQWLVSTTGLGDAKETPRKLTFCAHTIQSTLDCLVIPDTTKDFRFRDSIMVTSPPNVRFYAGAPMITKDGYKVGTLCIVDYIARPEGLSTDEKETLKALAAEAMKALEIHRDTKIAWFKNLKSTCFPNLRDYESEIMTGDDSEELKDKGKDGKFGGVDELELDVPKLIEEMEGMAWNELLFVMQKQIQDFGLPGMELHVNKCAALKDCSANRSIDFSPSPFSKKNVRFNSDEVKFVESCKGMTELWWDPTELFSFRWRACSEVDNYQGNGSHFISCVEAIANQEDVNQVVDCLLHLTAPPYCDIRGLESHIVDLLSMQRSIVVKAVLDEQRRSMTHDNDTKATNLRRVSKAISALSTRASERLAKCDEYIALNLYREIFGVGGAPIEHTTSAATL